MRESPYRGHSRFRSTRQSACVQGGCMLDVRASLSHLAFALGHVAFVLCIRTWSLRIRMWHSHLFTWHSHLVCALGHLAFALSIRTWSAHLLCACLGVRDCMFAMFCVRAVHLRLFGVRNLCSRCLVFAAVMSRLSWLAVLSVVSPNQTSAGQPRQTSGKPLLTNF